MHDPNTDGELTIGRWGFDSAYQTLPNPTILNTTSAEESIDSALKLLYN